MIAEKRKLFFSFHCLRHYTLCSPGESALEPLYLVAIKSHVSHSPNCSALSALLCDVANTQPIVVPRCTYLDSCNTRMARHEQSRCVAGCRKVAKLLLDVSLSVQVRSLRAQDVFGPSALWLPDPSSSLCLKRTPYICNVPRSPLPCRNCLPAS